MRRARRIGRLPGRGQVLSDQHRVLANSNLFVGDGCESSYVHRYGASGEYKGVVIKPGSEPGFVREPHGLRVVVPVGADRDNHRLQEFDIEGKHLVFVTAGTRPASGLSPASAAIKIERWDIIVCEWVPIGRLTLLHKVS